MPWANDGGSIWNASRCSPIEPGAGEPGDPCLAEDSPVSGIDSCVAAAMCWDVDADTLAGECVGFCGGDEEQPSCPVGTACLIANEGTLVLCLPTCDPLAAAPCEDDDGCYLVDSTWLCLPPGAPVFLDFETGIAPPLCAAGSTAVDPATLSTCPPAPEVCCAQICDVTAPACSDSLQCVAVDAPGNAGLCLD
jgi:hypothetical protein